MVRMRTTLFRGCLVGRNSAPLLLMTVVLIGQSGPTVQAQPAEDAGKRGAAPGSSYDQIAPVLLGQETFQDRMAKDKADKGGGHGPPEGTAGVPLRPRARSPTTRSKMSRGKPLQVGPATRLPQGMTWDGLAAMSPGEIREKDLFPKGFLPLPHPKHEVGGMVFPQMEIKLLPRLERFDVEFDLPEHFLPEFPPAIFLTTRPDLGDVSQGKMVTVENFQEIFAGILNSKDLEGMRLLVTQFPQQQFNATADRKTANPAGMQGVACFDCHVNGHTSGATHLVGDIRPQSHRRRLDTTSLRGVNIQRLFGSQRALKTRRGLHRVRAAGGVLRRRPGVGVGQGDQPAGARQPGPLHGGGPGAARLPAGPGPDGLRQARPREVRGRISPEMRGQELFFGKAQCATCHPAPYYTDNLMHDLKVERFYKTQTINGLVATSQGPIKTFTLRGIKESPPYLPRRPTAHARRHGGVLQPDPRAEADRPGEVGPRGVHAAALTRRPQDLRQVTDERRFSAGCPASPRTDPDDLHGRQAGTRQAG